MPAWKVKSGSADPAGALIKHLGADKTLVAVAADEPVVFTQQISLPAGSKAILRIKAGFAANESWKLRVTAGTQTLLDATVGGGAQPDWVRHELPLAPIAGQVVTLEVTATSPDEKPRKIYFARLLVKP
jgi:hypothetical protein